jgi:Fe-S-cluster-containing dehydrogenase component
VGKRAFVIDIGRCNGCHCCQIACKDEHVGNDWSPYAKPQPDTGQFWLKLNDYVRGTVPKVKLHYVPVLCQHCDQAPCLEACPVEGAIYRRADGLVIIDPEKCTGCRQCLLSCPYDALFFNEDLNIAQKCSGCAHLLDDGWAAPRCVDICPTGAMKFGDESEFAAEIAKATLLGPADETRPRVYYLNMPKRFIGGLVYDPAEKEIVKGARCTLVDSESGERRFALTDGFGDFWFKDLEEGTFTLVIEANGFAPTTYASLDTAEDVNLGEIPLGR